MSSDPSIREDPTYFVCSVDTPNDVLNYYFNNHSGSYPTNVVPLELYCIENPSFRFLYDLECYCSNSMLFAARVEPRLFAETLSKITELIQDEKWLDIEHKPMKVIQFGAERAHFIETPRHVFDMLATKSVFSHAFRQIVERIGDIDTQLKLLAEVILHPLYHHIHYRLNMQWLVVKLAENIGEFASFRHQGASILHLLYHFKEVDLVEYVMEKCGVDESMLMAQPLLFEAIQRLDEVMVRECVREHAMLTTKARTKNCPDLLNPLQYLIVTIAHERRTKVLLRARRIYNLLASEEYASDYVGDYSVLHLAEAFGLQGVLGLPADEHDPELILRLQERYSAKYAFATVLRGSFNDAEKAVASNDPWIVFAKKYEFEKDPRRVMENVPDAPIGKRIRWLLREIGLDVVVSQTQAPNSTG